MDLGLGVKVLSSLYSSRDDGENDGIAEHGSISQSAVDGDLQGRGRSSGNPSLEKSQPHRQCADGCPQRYATDSECKIRRRPSCELSFAESHYAETECIEDGGRLFKSLELGNGVSDDFECGADNWYHHSMDDFTSLNSQHGRAIPTVPMPNGTASAKESTTGKSSNRLQAKGEEDEIETMKNLFLSAWTNTKNGWFIKTKTDFKRDSAIWLLGKVYHCSQGEPIRRNQDKQNSADNNLVTFERFKLDFKSRLWFTYRTDIPTLPRSHLKSDVGWGCMLRCGQMLLGQALLVHRLGRDWTWNPLDNEQLHRQIIRYFGDAPHPSSPFSMHELVKIGMLQLGKKPGDWYGPASISHAMRQALKHAQQLDSLLNELSIYVARDGVVYLEDLFDEYYIEDSSPNESTNGATCTDQLKPKHRTYQERAVIVLVPMRLGSDSLNHTYVPCLKTLLNTPSCLGLIGGKPKHSLYFTGWQDDKLIYLDPHCCQDFVDVTQQHFPLNTFHCGSPRKLAFTKMDPSCAMGFYCRTRAELDQLLQEVPKIVATPLNHHYPMFQIERGRYSDVELWSDYACAEHTEPSPSKSTSKNEDFTLI